MADQGRPTLRPAVEGDECRARRVSETDHARTCSAGLGTPVMTTRSAGLALMRSASADAEKTSSLPLGLSSASRASSLDLLMLRRTALRAPPAGDRLLKLGDPLRVGVDLHGLGDIAHELTE